MVIPGKSEFVLRQASFVSTSDFRHITMKGDSSKADRLFRAAVTAFCSLTRPSRRDMAQLEDLTLPLYDAVSVESRRYVAAALSETQYPPAALVRRLCDDTVDIAAPLLIRSPVLRDIDLIALIGRHGLTHARAIARRPGLHATIARLVSALDRHSPATSEKAMPRSSEQTLSLVASNPVVPIRAPAVSPAPGPKGDAAEEARRRLLAMMRPARAERQGGLGPELDAGAYPKLRDTALTGTQLFFLTALADALAIDFSALRRIAATSSYLWLLSALRALDFGEEQAYLVTSAVYPQQFAHAEAIRLFLTRYRVMHRDIAIDRLRGWKAEAIAETVGRAQLAAAAAPPLQASNEDVAAPAEANRPETKKTGLK